MKYTCLLLDITGHHWSESNRQPLGSLHWAVVVSFIYILVLQAERGVRPPSMVSRYSVECGPHSGPYPPNNGDPRVKGGRVSKLLLY